MPACDIAIVGLGVMGENLALNFERNGHSVCGFDLDEVKRASFARRTEGKRAQALDTIRRLHEMGFWVEIVTLLIPGFNSSRDELTRLTTFVAEVSPS